MITSNFYNVVLQPTTLCNADCDYCYLPHRSKNMLMDVAVAEEIAKAITLQVAQYTVPIVWHGGEPLAAGIAHLTKLLDCFEPLRKAGKIKHNIQTNAVLINDEWCEIFKKYEFHIGVSLDGPVWANAQRVDWSGKPIFDYVIRGIGFLKKHELPFGIISVVKEDTIDRVEDLYEFFASLGCSRWNINIEEVEGANTGTEKYVDDNRVQIFWERLFAAWRKNPVLPIRELNHVLRYADAVINGKRRRTFEGLRIDPFPTIGYDGSVVLLSPEFAGIVSEEYDNFVVGNVLEDPLSEIIVRSLDQSYIAEYKQAIKMCSDTCPFFGFCSGGQASNRYFEHGIIAIAETAFCRNSRQRLFNAVVESL